MTLSTNMVAEAARIISRARADGVEIDRGNVVDLLADNMPVQLYILQQIAARLTINPSVADYKRAYRAAYARGSRLLYEHEGYTTEVYEAYGEAEEIYFNAIEEFGEAAWRNA